jgi:pyruvate dehydrogenase E2 component (dihydrolipoyllysine-residue acetyltransferase)
VPEILRMPEVAANTPEAVLASWNVERGAPYTAGTALATVETEKAAVDVEAEADGVVLRLLVDPGATVEVGAPIAVLGAVGEIAEVGETSQDGETPARRFSSPLARKIARERGLDLALVVGTGPGGRIRRKDVEDALAVPAPAAVSAPAAAPAPAAVQAPAPTPAPAAAVTTANPAYRDVPNSRVRQAIARRLTESKQTAPHFYLRGSARIDRLLALREEINAGSGPRVSVNDLLVKAVGTAHTRVPSLNVTWAGDSIRHYPAVDVGIAVATDGGLVTPVLRGVDRLSLHQVATATRDLADRARQRRLRQSELDGGTITVTNLGMLGTEEFAAIINPPQASILAVGAARPEPVVVDGALAVGTVLRVTLSVDHRPVDGVMAAEWMRAFLELLEAPLQILL